MEKCHETNHELFCQKIVPLFHCFSTAVGILKSTMQSVVSDWKVLEKVKPCQGDWVSLAWVQFLCINWMLGYCQRPVNFCMALISAVPVIRSQDQLFTPTSGAQCYWENTLYVWWWFLHMFLGKYSACQLVRKSKNMISVRRRMDNIQRGQDLFGQYYTQKQSHLLVVGLSPNDILCEV